MFIFGLIGFAIIGYSFYAMWRGEMSFTRPRITVQGITVYLISIALLVLGVGCIGLSFEKVAAIAMMAFGGFSYSISITLYALFSNSEN